MIYTPRYIFNSDLEKTICTCGDSKKYRVLFTHSNSIEKDITSTLVGLSSQIIAVCSKCGRIYKFELKYNPNLQDKAEIKNVVEIKKDISDVRDEIKLNYKSYEEMFSFRSEEFYIKIINEKYDDYKKFTEFMYIEK
ncbi:hypothetical protein [Romboutsia sp. Marseille-P6047]|uniref:hypothetical protein n=1 Tax=Romboutsia sp. Marseille-P6047 TaxID=2161817 RepID=UPI0008230769|nr:hypothetical protein [Romboutsia sp. Marseille-P6047]SCH66477.1 Uncharacterised protein [uncultured Clostridium sp.]